MKLHEILGGGVGAGLFVLAALLGASLWALRMRLRQLQEAARWLSANVGRILKGEAEPASSGPLERTTTQGFRSAYLGQHNGQAVLSRSHREVLSTQFEVFSERGFGAAMGSAFTGIALIITFGLIAFVLFNNVGPAIQQSLEEHSNSADQLSHAVALMGGKFLVSCLGIGLTLAHQSFVATWYRPQVQDAIDKVSRDLDGSFVLAEQVRWETELASLAAIKGLQRIEVSVKNLGEDVNAGLRSMLKEALAQQIGQLLEDMKLRADELQDFVRAFIEKELKTATDELLKEMRAAHETLRGQSGSQLEQLLEKLEGVLSGGFSSQSRSITVQMEQFATVFPTMAGQLSAVASRMEGMLAQLEKQQAGSTQLVEGLAEASRVHVASFGQDLARVGTDALTKVFGETAAELDGVTRNLREVAELQGAGSGRVRENLAAVMVDIEKSFGIVRESAGLLQGLVREVGTATSGISAQIGALAAAAKGIDVSSRSMLTVTEKVQVIEREIAEIAANEAKLQVTQRELMQQMQNVWPQLLETVSRSVADSTRQLDQTWAQTSERFRTAVETVNQGFAASVDDLADAVDKLNASKQPPRAQAG